MSDSKQSAGNEKTSPEMVIAHTRPADVLSRMERQEADADARREYEREAREGNR